MSITITTRYDAPNISVLRKIWRLILKLALREQMEMSP